MVYVDVEEMQDDIQKMLLVLQALTPRDSQGADLVDAWKEKYRTDREGNEVRWNRG